MGKAFVGTRRVVLLDMDGVDVCLVDSTTPLALRISLTWKDLVYMRLISQSNHHPAAIFEVAGIACNIKFP